MIRPVRPPEAAATLVEMHAATARKFAPRAEPPLNPCHPTQRQPVPRTITALLFSHFQQRIHRWETGK